MNTTPEQDLDFENDDPIIRWAVPAEDLDFEEDDAWRSF